MSATRPLLILLAFFTLLLSVPLAADASSGGKSTSHRHGHKAAKHHKKHKKHKKHKSKKRRPHASQPAAKHTDAAANADDAATDDGPIGTVSAVSGDTVTVAFKDGTSLTGQVTEDTVVSCPGADADDDADADDPSESADDSPSGDDPADNDDDSDDPDFRSLRSYQGCSIAVGAPVYDADVDEGDWDVLDLQGA